MGTMGLALPWKARIASDCRANGQTRAEPSEHYAVALSPTIVDAITEDAALAAGAAAGNLQTLWRPNSIHGARMKESCAQSSRKSRGRGRCGAGDVPKSAEKHREFSRAIEFCSPGPTGF